MAFRTAILAATAFLIAAAAPAFAQELVVVPNRVIYPGQEVTADALDMVPLRRQLPNPAAIVHEPHEITGKVARRTLLTGRLIPSGSVREAHLVEAGQPVELRFVHGSLVIATTGVPLQPGAAGDVVRVRNLDSGVVISGVVMADGTIRVGA